MKAILSQFENPFTQLLEAQQRQGRISKDMSAALIGETISNSMLSLCQRVLLRRDTLEQEYRIDPVSLVPIQMKLFIKALIAS